MVWHNSRKERHASQGLRGRDLGQHKVGPHEARKVEVGQAVRRLPHAPLPSASAATILLLLCGGASLGAPQPLLLALHVPAVPRLVEEPTVPLVPLGGEAQSPSQGEVPDLPAGLVSHRDLPDSWHQVGGHRLRVLAQNVKGLPVLHRASLQEQVRQHHPGGQGVHANIPKRRPRGRCPTKTPHLLVQRAVELGDGGLGGAVARVVGRGPAVVPGAVHVEHVAAAPLVAEQAQGGLGSVECAQKVGPHDLLEVARIALQKGSKAARAARVVDPHVHTPHLDRGPPRQRLHGLWVGHVARPAHTSFWLPLGLLGEIGARLAHHLVVPGGDHDAVSPAKKFPGERPTDPPRATRHHHVQAPGLQFPQRCKSGQLVLGEGGEPQKQGGACEERSAVRVTVHAREVANRLKKAPGARGDREARNEAPHETAWRTCGGRGVGQRLGLGARADMAWLGPTRG
mmetsp:Transcript_3383/g.12301  ORF Transcript_3383/g.12301 Transcript_3383/m.12301 type:complete len:456 (+) Transcript_3383:808-2175(+)